MEPRVVEWYTDAGHLKPGHTLTIAVNEEGRPACARSCAPMLEATAKRTGIRIIYTAPGGHTEVFGAD